MELKLVAGLVKDTEALRLAHSAVEMEAGYPLRKFDGFIVRNMMADMMAAVRAAFPTAIFYTKNVQWCNTLNGSVDSPNEFWIGFPNCAVAAGVIGYRAYRRSDTMYLAVHAPTIVNSKYKSFDDKYNAKLSDSIKSFTKNLKQHIVIPSTLKQAAHSFVTVAQKCTNTHTTAIRAADNAFVAVKQSDALKPFMREVMECGAAAPIPAMLQEQLAAWIAADAALVEQQGKPVHLTMMQVLPNDYVSCVDVYDAERKSGNGANNSMWKTMSAYTLKSSEIPEEVMARLYTLNVMNPTEMQYIDDVGMRIHESVYWVVRG